MKVALFFVPLLLILISQCSPLNDQSAFNQINKQKEELTADLSLDVHDNELIITLTNTSNSPFVIDGDFEFLVSISFYNLKGEKYVNTNTGGSISPEKPFLACMEDDDIPLSSKPFKKRFVILKPKESMKKIIKSGDIVKAYSCAISSEHKVSVIPYAYICPNFKNVGKIELEYGYDRFTYPPLVALCKENNFKIPDNYFKGNVFKIWTSAKATNKTSKKGTDG